MKSFLILQVFGLLLLMHTIQGSVKWTLDTTTIVYGNPVTLVCIVPETTCPENYVRRWFGGPYQTLLGLNYRSTNLTKYNMFTVKNSESFGLIIYNFDESDVGCNYTCSCGFDQFTQILSIREKKFIYPVDRWKTQQTIVNDNTKLCLNFSIEKVYPMAKCRIKLNDLVIVEHMHFLEEYRDNWLLPNQSLCDTKIQIECWNEFSEDFSFIIQKQIPKVDCYGPSLEGNTILLPVTLSLTAVIVALTAASLIICKMKCTKEQYYKSKTDIEQTGKGLLNKQHKVDGNMCLNKLEDS